MNKISGKEYKHLHHKLDAFTMADITSPSLFIILHQANLKIFLNLVCWAANIKK